jgi:hypothetical protein
MKRTTWVVAAALLAATVSVAFAGDKERFGTDVTEWSSSTTPVPGVVIPVGGSGQVNGNFATAERNGVEIGIRAQRRFLQNVDPLANSVDKKVAVYQADTGTSDVEGRATWNYDLHVDLRGAQGVMKGKTVGDFSLTLDTDIGTTLFGQPVPWDLGTAIPNAVLFQTSLNPKFGNAPFDATAEGTYSFTLTLTPVTFNGPPISVSMRVEVTNP